MGCLTSLRPCSLPSDVRTLWSHGALEGTYTGVFPCSMALALMQWGKERVGRSERQCEARVEIPPLLPWCGLGPGSPGEGVGTKLGGLLAQMQTL